MSERITTVSEELHEKGMRWCDMFAEEDNRAIETYTIETVGESAQQAAEREKLRRDIDRKRMELALKYERFR
ncbi:unnamed protein product [Cylicostephanus goldi]|uniref:Uncharacterized protein n=1 Tax=Cylicostephanus goldi TaxID=71465 RepID=A0A3P6U6C0_CYLGO|nr:unnamed protein product [Cylicostephanus goldi]